jgi:hypothetical protein
VLKELETQQVSSTFARNRYQSACAAYQDFLDKKITYEELKRKIGELPAGPSEVFAPLRRVVFVPVPTIGLLGEILDGRQTLIETPLDTILGLDQFPDRGLLLVSGLFGGHGAVIGYRDANDDGVYDAGSFFVAVQPTPLLTGDLELVDRPGTDRVFVHDGPSGALYPLLDTNENGLPDTLGPNAAAGTPIPPDFVRILLAPDGTAFGFEGIAGTDDLFTTDEPTLRLRDVDGDGLYDRTQLRTFGERLGLEPIVLGPLSVGDTTAAVHASAGSSLEILAVDRATGYVNDLLATVGGVPSLAVRTIPLARPLAAGEGLVVHDVTDGVIGQATLVSSPGPDVHVVDAPLVDPVAAGDTADFRILVTNDGRATATGVVVAAAIPPVVAWAVDDPSCVIDGGALVCAIGDLEPAESRVVHLTAPLHGDDCGGTLFTIVGATATNESPFDARDDEDAATISIDCD